MHFIRQNTFEYILQHFEKKDDLASERARTALKHP